ncbi:MAG: quinolinate synthase NadA [Deltaproteobacteria bacterium]|nr:quinolinate synthase NadA [Deltaproteobacteria bacterium]MBP6834234.1 quinolinate synthase NadA [Deltaproteobacteria bacterium]
MPTLAQEHWTMAVADDLAEDIKRLKREKNAVLLAHYYVDGEVQDVADFVGDSLQLSQAAAKTTADVIVFAGVHFMAETAKILNPTRRVVLPDMDAGCSLSDGCPADRFAAFTARHPDHYVISYINCSSGVKALSDCICTSSNAEKIVRSVPEGRPIIFAPDRNLGAYVAKQTGREMLLWRGSCIVHETFSEKKLIALKVRHPEAKVLAHPECEPQLLAMADFIGSTSALLNYSKQSPAREFIVLTESGILHQMRKSSPDKEFIPAPPDANCACNDCPFMKKNTLEAVHRALVTLGPEITIPEDLRLKALRPIERMLELSV